MKSVVRNMQAGDLPVVLELGIDLGYESTLTQYQERFQELKARDNHQLMVATVNEEVRGWIHLEVVHDLLESQKVEVKAMIVHKNSRGHGIGHELIGAAKAWAKQKKIGIIYLSTNIKRDRALAFYQREGFGLDKTSHFLEMKI